MAADMTRPWKGAVDPFRIYGNLYFVGTEPASTHLIDTGDGLILLDPGYQQSLYLVLDNIRRLGFDPRDIKKIIHSHGHYDHLGATRAMVEMTGARTSLGEDDLEFARETHAYVGLSSIGSCTFEPDVLLKDGDTVTLGNTTILCVHTPGHSKGTVSFFFDAYGEEGALRCGMFGGVGFNTMRRDFLDKNGLDDSCRYAFLRSVERMMQEDVDIFLGNHVGNNDTLGKGAIVREGKGNPFLHTNREWHAFLDTLKERMVMLL